MKQRNKGRWGNLKKPNMWKAINITGRWGGKKDEHFQKEVRGGVEEEKGNLRDEITKVTKGRTGTRRRVIAKGSEGRHTRQKK